MRFIRHAGLLINRGFSWSVRLSRFYLRAWTMVLDLLPDNHWLKRHIGNSLWSTAWPPLRLPARLVSLGAGITVWLVPRSGSLGFRSLYERRLGHEPTVFDFIAQRLSRYEAVLEVGANVGVYTLFFSKWFAQHDDMTRVFSFEPSPRAFACLTEHLELNHCDNVATFQHAVSTVTGKVAFFENPSDLMKGSLEDDTAGQFSGCDEQPVEVKAIGGEEIAALLASFRRVLVKIDVVGSEPDVLQALVNVIRLKRPDIVLGVWSQNLAGLNRLEFLRERYRLHKIEGAGLVPKASFADSDYCNYFLEVAG